MIIRAYSGYNPHVDLQLTFFFSNDPRGLLESTMEENFYEIFIFNIVLGINSFCTR